LSVVQRWGLGEGIENDDTGTLKLRRPRQFLLARGERFWKGMPYDTPRCVPTAHRLTDLRLTPYFVPNSHMTRARTATTRRAISKPATCRVLLTAHEFAENPPAQLQHVLRELRRNQSSCQEIAESVTASWEIDGPDRDAIDRIAREADRSGFRNAYHNPAHTRDVTVSWANLAVLNNHLHHHERAPLRLEKHGLAIGLMAALGHDLRHDGTTNHAGPRRRQGGRGAGRTRIPFRLESIAAEKVGQIMAKSKVDPAKAASVTAAIMATDPVDGYSALEHHAGKFHSDIVLHEGLAPLQDPACWHVAALLRDADLVTSAGLSAAEHDHQAGLLMQELGLDEETPDDTERFFGETARGGFASPAGALFMPQFNALRAINRSRAGTGMSLAEAEQRVMAS
jgi:hypothetical protein